MQTSLSCILCDSPAVAHWHTDQRKAIAGRHFYRCNRCALIFVPQHQRLDATRERAVYDLHDNTPGDPGYRQFLSRTFEPVCQHLHAGASGLDFGSGPGPTLSLMFREAGYPCVDYDLYYANDRTLLTGRYDFITATEVFEHLGQPAKVLDQLVSCLKPAGILAIMTKRPMDKEAFARWHYPLDPTHISFFADSTFDFIATRWHLTQLHRSKDVVILQKYGID